MQIFIFDGMSTWARARVYVFSVVLLVFSFIAMFGQLTQTFHYTILYMYNFNTQCVSVWVFPTEHQIPYILCEIEICVRWTYTCTHCVLMMYSWKCFGTTTIWIYTTINTIIKFCSLFLYYKRLYDCFQVDVIKIRNLP